MRRPVAAAVPSVIPCVDDGDTPGSVWLCDKCRDAAGAYGLHPLDSIDEMGPCRACTSEPAIPHSYDLYAFRFICPAIGKFRYDIPADIGRTFLLPRSTVPHQERGDDSRWTYGRTLTAIAAAFSL